MIKNEPTKNIFFVVSIKEKPPLPFDEANDRKSSAVNFVEKVSRWISRKVCTTRPNKHGRVVLVPCKK